MYNYKQILEWKYASNSYTMLDAYDYDTLVWTDTAEKPSKELLETKIDLIKTSELLVVQQKRASEYPQIQDYIDGIVKGDQAQIDAYIAACQAVKLKYPKPE
jgi:hypothetical protein